MPDHPFASPYDLIEVNQELPLKNVFIHFGLQKRLGFAEKANGPGKPGRLPPTHPVTAGQFSITLWVFGRVRVDGAICCHPQSVPHSYAA
jgi:hypothetical protein